MMLTFPNAAKQLNFRNVGTFHDEFYETQKELTF